MEEGVDVVVVVVYDDDGVVDGAVASRGNIGSRFFKMKPLPPL